MLMPDRMSKQRLEELHQLITDKDRAILETLKKCRYLTGQQIFWLYFSGCAETPTAALSQAHRCLNRLKEYGLIQHLERRIGGVRAGSGSFVWTLTSGGFRLLPTPRGNAVWNVSTVKSILQNEKYAGNALLQKKFTVDFLTKTQKVNEGELPP